MLTTALKSLISIRSLHQTGEYRPCDRIVLSDIEVVCHKQCTVHAMNLSSGIFVDRLRRWEQIVIACHSCNHRRAVVKCLKSVCGSLARSHMQIQGYHWLYAQQHCLALYCPRSLILHEFMSMVGAGLELSLEASAGPHACILYPPCPGPFKWSWWGVPRMLCHVAKALSPALLTELSQCDQIRWPVPGKGKK